jgi:DNA (cytosine-5)-methyltransferase 1
VSKLDPSVTATSVGWTGEGLIGSPPCGPFSPAGNGKGRADSGLLLAAVGQIAAGRHPRGVLARLRHRCSDDRTPLVLEPLRWALDLRPKWIALEQVPPVLPLWQACGEVLSDLGYSVWTGNLQAEAYGVPQTRKRAILIARLGGSARAPEPTHSRYHPRDPSRLDPGMPCWVSMAEALGWGATSRPCATVTGGGTGTGGGEPIAHWGRFMRSNYGTGGDPAARGARSPSEPAPTVTGRINRNMWVLQGGPQEHSTAGPSSAPAGTIHSQRSGNLTWRFAGTGATSGMTPDQRVTAAEAAVLQSFPADYPFDVAPRKGDQYRMVGDAVPPLLAAHILMAAGAGVLDLPAADGAA